MKKTGNYLSSSSKQGTFYHNTSLNGERKRPGATALRPLYCTAVHTKLASRSSRLSLHQAVTPRALRVFSRRNPPNPSLGFEESPPINPSRRVVSRKVEI